MHGYYECNKCKGKFSRKWNALRHNDKVHHGSAEIFKNQTKIISQTDNQQKEKPHSELKHLAWVEDDKLLEFCEKLIKPIEVLEQLSDTFSEGERNKFITKLIIKSIITPNPIKTLYDAIGYQNAVRGKIKILNYLAKYNKTNLIQAELFLKSQINTNQSNKY